MASSLYILGDADHVRNKIEQHLFTGQVKDLKHFSDTLTTSIIDISQKIQKVFFGEILMVGGDDVLFRVPQDEFSTADLELLSQQFASETGCTISFGVGSDIKNAYINLRHAKSKGGNTIVSSEPVV